MSKSLKTLLAFSMRTMLRKEIIIALIAKSVLLFILWKICFAHPVAEHLSRWDVVKHLVEKV